MHLFCGAQFVNAEQTRPLCWCVGPVQRGVFVFPPAQVVFAGRCCPFFPFLPGLHSLCSALQVGETLIFTVSTSVSEADSFDK